MKPTDFWDEDDLCSECGAKDYHPSKAPGICVSCYAGCCRPEPERLNDWDNGDWHPFEGSNIW